MASRAILARRTHLACSVEVKDTYMAASKLDWLNPQNGGFIQPSDGGRDVFAHISAAEQAGLTTLVEGQKVSYDMATTERCRQPQDRLVRRNRAMQS
jgi:cold shock protein